MLVQWTWKKGKQKTELHFLFFFLLLSLVNSSSHCQKDLVHFFLEFLHKIGRIWVCIKGITEAWLVFCCHKSAFALDCQCSQSDEWIPWTQFSTVSVTAPLLKHHITQHSSTEVVTGTNKHNANNYCSLRHFTWDIRPSDSCDSEES